MQEVITSYQEENLLTKFIDKYIKKKILIFSIHEEKFFKMFENKVIINPRRINLLLLINSLLFCLMSFNFQKKSIKKNYLKSIIKKNNPDIILTSNVETFSDDLKFIFPNLIYIKYQNNYFHNHNIQEYVSIIKNKKIDYFYIYDETTKKIFEKHLETNFIVSGPLNSIFLKPKILHKYDYDIMYISEFRKSNKNKYHLQIQSDLISQLNIFCKENNLNLLIACNSYRKDKNLVLSDEINFYKNMNINASYTDSSSYNYIDKFKIAICLKSNFGVELIFANKPVIFLNHYDKFLEKKIDCPYIYNHSEFIINHKKNFIFNNIISLLNLDSKLLQTKFKKSLRLSNPTI